MLHLFLYFHFLGPVRVNQESVRYKVLIQKNYLTFIASCEANFANLNKLPGGVTMIVVQFGNTYE